MLSAPAVGMGGATGVPLALGLAVVRPDGEARCGVFAAEAMVDADQFSDRRAPLCTPAKKGTATDQEGGRETPRGRTPSHFQ